MILNLEDVINQPYACYWAEQEEAYVEVLRAIEEKRPCPSAAEWDRHWSEYDQPRAPKFLKRTGVFRWQGRFVTAPVDAEERYFTALKCKLFHEYLSDVHTLAEFGCGTGYNLKQYAVAYPDRFLYAYDWSEASVNLVNRSEIGAAYLFDMRTLQFGSVSAQLPPKGCGVLTCGSMEQLGDDFRPFLDFLAKLQPKVCVHVEPCVELYNESKLFDRVAAMYHRSRGYLGRWIAEVEKLGEVMLKERTGFGNMYNEGYSVVVWRPR